MLKKPYIRSGKAPGFALVVTLSLMVLLAILAVGLLGLSAVTLRSTSQGSAQGQARANARLALMIAIGELQKHAGPDTRVTAPSGIVDESSPPLTGVWRSWEGTDHETTGRPVAPDYDSKKRSGADGGRFLSWLVSGADSANAPTDPASLAYPGQTGDSVPMLSGGTLGAQPGQVHLPPLTLENGTGSYAWWVSGENQKARLPQAYGPANNTAAGWSDIAKSHAVADPKPFELEALLTDSSALPKVVSRNTSDFIAKAGAATTPREFFHDLSIHSVGLLTNTATGGWRKDLSLVTENWDKLNASGLPFFRISPTGDSSAVERPAVPSPMAAQSVFYPWSEYPSTVATGYPYSKHGAVTSWRNLVDYATAYQRISPTAGGNSIPFSWPRIDDSIGNTTMKDIDYYQFLHTIRTTPLIARVHWLFSHRTLEITPATNPKTYRLQLLITPVVTLWNPYNVSINTPSSGMMIRMAKSPPCVLRYYRGDGTPLPDYRKLMTGTATAGQDSLIANYPQVLFNLQGMEYNIASAFTLKPGETRVFSPAPGQVINTTKINMAAGYNPSGGHFRNIDFLGPALKGGDKIKLDLKFDNLINIVGPGTGIFLDLFTATDTRNVRQRYLMTVPGGTAAKYWPDITSEQLPSPQAMEIEGTWRPFFSTVFGSRVSSNTSMPGRGLAQTSPLVSHTNMRHNQTNPGANHPANSAFDYSFIAHPLGGDSRLPNANNTNDRGYIISGFDAAEGLSRVILNELPLRPLASLAELQNWDLRGHNPLPPFQLNIIGNSDASPLIPANAVSQGYNPKGLQYDDPYCANHVLFDDWFFSSIAPEPQGFGNAMRYDLKQRYKEFLGGRLPLANRSYRAIPEDSALNAAAQDKLVDDMLNFDGWQRVASRLEVEGMFNVNSTSVTAWRALLGHARKQKVPYHTETGIALSGETDHPVSRSSVAGDVKAGEPGMSGAFPESSEFTGYRVFDEKTLDALAEKIVEQVRLRGPFLSLSEFVNRQLGSGDLALAGAVQTALNKISEDAATDPNKVLRGLSEDTLNPNDPKLVGAGYLHPEAAKGKSAYGLPGWIRQADVLTPLAPILSARDDTFTIRAYGDARDKAGKVIAKAWCEATVVRTRDFVDPAEAADLTSAPTIPANETFGRRFEIEAFRWLSPDEV